MFFQQPASSIHKDSPKTYFELLKVEFGISLYHGNEEGKKQLQQKMESGAIAVVFLHMPKDLVIGRLSLLASLFVTTRLWCNG